MKTTIPTLSLLSFLALASTAAAQAPFPGAVNVNGGWVPCNHQIAIDAGLSCTAPTPKPVPTATPTQADADCQNVNPYLNPDQAAECTARPNATDAVPTFRVGHVYAYGYSELQARILGLAQDIDGVQVVTVRWLRADSKVEAFRTPATPGGSSNWTYIGR